MKVYISGKMIEPFETSFPTAVTIESAADLQATAARSDYVMSAFRDGYTQKGQFKRSHTCIEDYIQSDCLYLDVDNDGDKLITLKDFARRFGMVEHYITTSKSHGKEKHGRIADRFHVLFPLETPITDGKMMKTYLRLLHSHVGIKISDPACVDVARKFFGNPTNESFHEEGHFFIDTILRPKYLDFLEKNVQKETLYIPPPSSMMEAIKQSYLESVDKAYRMGWFDGYRSWITIGMALKQAGYPLDAWLSVCHTKTDRDLARTKWDTFHPDEIAGIKFIRDIHAKLWARPI